MHVATERKRALDAIARANDQMQYEQLVQLAQMVRSEVVVDDSQYVWNRPLGLIIECAKKDANVG